MCRENNENFNNETFPLVFTPVCSYCKQEHRDHAWPVIYCGRNLNLSTTSGLKPDARSLGTKFHFCKTLNFSIDYMDVVCLFTQGFWRVFWGLGLPLVHTPQKKTLKFHSCWKSEWVQENPCWLRLSVWDFPRHLTFGQNFLATRVQAFSGTTASSLEAVCPTAGPRSPPNSLKTH